jgi:5'-deoxynucleotidase YfbR-like HD superfamily hydrolase
LYALAEKLEEIAGILEDVRMEQLVGTDPEPNDEELLEEVCEYLNRILTELFAKISDKVEALEESVNEGQ